MFEHLDDLVTELERIEGSWTDLYAEGDQAKIAAAGRRQKELEPVVSAYARIAPPTSTSRRRASC